MIFIHYGVLLTLWHVTVLPPLARVRCVAPDPTRAAGGVPAGGLLSQGGVRGVRPLLAGEAPAGGAGLPAVVCPLLSLVLTAYACNRCCGSDEHKYLNIQIFK